MAGVRRDGLVERTDALAVHPRVLAVWFHAIGFGDAQRIRIATGEDPATSILIAEEVALARVRELEPLLAGRQGCVAT